MRAPGTGVVLVALGEGFAYRPVVLTVVLVLAFVSGALLFCTIHCASAAAMSFLE